MRLATFVHEGRAAWGLVARDDGGDFIADVTAAETGLPATLLGALWEGPEAFRRAAAAAQQAPRLRLNSVSLRAPIPRPGKILAIARNYAAHAAEMGSGPPPAQTWFNKQTTAVTGPFDPVIKPAGADKLDYEGELVAVIGRVTRRATSENALSAIAGLCVGSDFTARDWQAKAATMILGKGHDGFAPFGPWLTLPQSSPALSQISIRTLVNGELRQQAAVTTMIHNLAEQIVELSAAMTLEPGDVIYTGTPAGVGHAMTPPRYLVPGDTVRVEIPGLGHIENRIVAP